MLGVPIDSGTGGRPGARFGPAAIREASALISGNLYHVGLETEVFEHLRIVDVGDVPVTPGQHDRNLDAAEKWLRELMPVAERVVVLGGDHSVLLPVLRAVADKHGPVSFVHWDAHADTWDGGPERLLTHATAVRRVIEEGLTNQVFQIGLRGYGPSRETFAWAGEHGVEHWTMMDVDETGLTDIVQQVISTVTGKVYISIDIDVLDPSYAPGTGTPEPGGLTSRELLAGIRDLVRATDVVGLDVVEVAPPYDHADVTALVANRCVLEFLAATAQRKAAG